VNRAEGIGGVVKILNGIIAVNEPSVFLYKEESTN